MSSDQHDEPSIEESQPPPPAAETEPSPSAPAVATETIESKTLTITHRNRGGDGESREGHLTITSRGDYDGSVNFRCNCPRIGCACNFSEERIDLLDLGNNVVTTVAFNETGLALGRAEDVERKCTGQSRMIAETYHRIVAAWPMFRCSKT